MNEKEVFKSEEANRLITLLQDNAIPYTVVYTTSNEQREGTLHKWVFEFDATELIDVFITL